MKCAYCVNDEKEKSFLTCKTCHKCIHATCLKMGYIPGGLMGDAFFDFLCFECSGFKKEKLTRQKIPWITVIALALFNLHKKSEGVSMKGYFHYKIHIVNFIDKHWNVLFEPTFKRKKSWTGTVSGTLSHFCPAYFLNGNEVLRDSGWWRLTDPNLTPQQLWEFHTKTQAAKKKGGKQFIKPTGSNSVQNSGASSPIPGSSNEMSLPACEDMTKLDPNAFGSTAVSSSSNLLGDDQALKAQHTTFSFPNFGASEVFSDYLFNEDENLTDVDIDMEDVNSLVLSATGSESFQDLEYLLQPEAAYMPESESTNHSFSSGPTDTDPLFLSHGGNIISEDFMSVREETPHGSVCAGTDDGSSEQDDSPPISEKVLTESLFKVTPPEKRIPPWEVEEEQKKQPAETKCIPMSEYEELQLLGQLRRAANVRELTGHARQLYRKLCVRRIKRERGMPLFNLDNMFRPGKTLWRSTSVWTKPLRKGTAGESTDVRILDRFHYVHTSTQGTGQRQKCSFKFRLMGCAEPSCFVSPFTHRELKPYIWRDCETKPLWLNLLSEIQKKANRNNPDWKPPPKSPIDYCYVRPQHISTINSLCSEFFYPGIDLSETLQYPDFSCVVLYKKLIIGFAFMVPDAGFNETYISFLFTRPEWRRSGIASFMLYHLIQTCMGKDVTLHVSATNPAVILYQKFGFKVEEFVQDFYDKYFPADSKECKHALFLRLSR